MLKPIETVDSAEDAAKMAENVTFEIDASVLLEKVKINLDADGDDKFGSWRIHRYRSPRGR